MIADIFVHDTYFSFNVTPAQGIVIALVLLSIGQEKGISPISGLQ